MSNSDTLDPEQAHQQMREFQDSEIDRVVRELEEHKIDGNIIRRVRVQLDSPSTVMVPEDDFTIVRNINQGFDIDWHAGKRAA